MGENDEVTCIVSFYDLQTGRHELYKSTELYKKAAGSIQVSIQVPSPHDRVGGPSKRKPLVCGTEHVIAETLAQQGKNSSKNLGKTAVRCLKWRLRIHGGAKMARLQNEYAPIDHL